MNGVKVNEVLLFKKMVFLFVFFNFSVVLTRVFALRVDEAGSASCVVGSLWPDVVPTRRGAG